MAAQGYFQVRATTSISQIPIADVNVTVERELAGGGNELLNVQMTDRNGLTQPIAVSTPEEAESRSPEQGKGWTDVLIYADHPSFERIRVLQAQVFPEVTTVQQLDMIPLAELPERWDQTEVFPTPAQTL